MPALSGPMDNALSFTDDEAARLIVADSALVREARVLVPALTHRARTVATKPEMKNIIFARFPLFPQPQRAEWEWDVWWADYFDTLEGLTAEAVENGLKAWIAKPDSRFLPKPGELRALALATPTPTARTLTVLKHALATADGAPAPRGRFYDPPRLKFIPKPEEDREAVRQMQAAHRAEFDRRQAERPRPATHSTAGPVADGQHVTQAMVDLLSRQARDANA